MKALIETLKHSEKVYRGNIINLRIDHVELPDGRAASREVVEHPGAVAVVALTSERRVILVKQYRTPVGRVLLEVPAGKLTPGERPENCARRELEEETGMRAGKLNLLCTFYTTPGFSDEIMYVFYAGELKKSRKNPDADEFLETTTLSLEEAVNKIFSGEIIDAKTITGLLSVAYLGEDNR